MLVYLGRSAIITSITKFNWLKNKRILVIVLAVLFLGVVFFLKTKSEHKNEVANQIGLAFGEEKIGDLVSLDSDQDGVADWEENLWGTDPNVRDTDGDGREDDIAIAKLKAENESGFTPIEGDEEEVLTQTDKFSRELFSTVATLTQSGPIDQETVDKLGETLAGQLQNVPIRKVFLASDIKISAKDDKTAITKYNDDLGRLYLIYSKDMYVLDIIQEFIASGEEPDSTILLKLDPIIKQTSAVLSGMAKMEVPISIMPLHLNFMNSLEQNMETLEDIQLFGTDTIIAMSAMSQFEKNSALLEESIIKLNAGIVNKLNN